MAYERYPRSTDHSDDAGYGRDYSGRDNSYSSARDYAAAGRLNDGRYGRDERSDYDRDDGRGGQGRSTADWGHSDYGRGDGDRQYQGRQYQGPQYQGRQFGGRHDQGRDHPLRGDDRYGRGGQEPYRGSYTSDGHRFVEGADRGRDDRDRGRDYGRQPQGNDQDDRGFFQRAGDEVRSWFGDDDAERRREADSRYDERAYRGGGQHDAHYGSWRSGQIAALDRDYDEYRDEHRSRFENEFASWRTGRQTQRDSLSKVTEHQEVVGSDGAHVGTVDKVRGDRILLTKNDTDAGGRHHSIPSKWLVSVDDKVTLSKTADEAKAAWRDEERNQALFGDDDNDRAATTRSQSTSQASAASGSTDGRNLNRSFSGTY